jgi:NitT/TauT family transport system substrate-binding protein
MNQMQTLTTTRRTWRVLLWGVAAGAAFIAAAQAYAIDVVRVGAAAMGMPQGPIMMAAVAPEIYAKHGIELKVTDFRGSATNTVVAQIANNVDVSSNGAGFVLDAIAEGADLKAISLTVGPMTDLYLAPKAIAAVGVKPTDSLEARLKSLKGMRIGSNGGPSSSHWLNLYELFKKYNLPQDYVRLVPINDVQAMMASIRNNQIDGGMWSTGGLAGLNADNSGVRWISLAREKAIETADIPYSAMWASSQWIEKNPDLARRLALAFAEAARLMKTDKAKYSKLIKNKYYPDMSQAIWDDTYEESLPAYIDDGKFTKAGWDKLLQQRVAVTKKDYSKATFDRSVADIAKR